MRQLTYVSIGIPEKAIEIKNKTSRPEDVAATATECVKEPRQGMTIAQIKQKAVSFGISTGRLSKMELVHAIQLAEGNSLCFGLPEGQCPHTDCCFRVDCLKI